ncbi:MAG: AAA family ATPase [Candidatus Dormibacteria bacterium]
MELNQARAAIRVAVAAPFPEIVGIQESTAEYADRVEVCGTISSADAVFDQTRILQPDVLLLSDALGFEPPDSLARLGALSPHTRLVVLVRDEAQRARVMADAVLRFDAPAAELCDALVAAAESRTPEAAPPAHSRAQPPGDASAVADHPGPGDPPLQDGTDPSGIPARTVLVFSGKGGVGKSIIATNLATALAIGGARVAIVDLNLQYGDVGVLLRLENHPTSIASVARDGGPMDPVVLESALATSPQGVRVLLAPSSPESGDVVTAANLESILTALSHRHDFVVVDAPAHLEERIVAVMEVADHILLVSSFGITSVKDAKTTLRLLQSLGIARERVSLVLNQTGPHVSLPAEEIEKALHFPVLGNLPFAARMEESIESGRPLILSEPRGGFSRQMRRIAEHVARSRDPGAPARLRRHALMWRLRFGR